MKLLLDAHLLLRAASRPEVLSAEARALMEDPQNSLQFSAASLWEIAVKKTGSGAAISKWMHVCLGAD